MLPLVVRYCRIAVASVVVVAAIAATRVAVAQDLPTEPERRMPVRGGSLTLKVADFAAARAKVLKLAGDAGAEVTDGRTYVTEKGRKNGYVRLRLGAEHLGELLPAIRSVGTLASDDLFTQDQASHYEDLGRRVIQLRKHQQRLDKLLNSRRNLRGSDVLYIQERLFRAGVDEEQLLQERTDIERQARAANITITLFEPLPGKTVTTPLQKAQNSFAHWFDNSKRRAELHRAELIRKVATVSAFALVYAPIWIPLTLGFGLLLRLAGRHLSTLAKKTALLKNQIQQAALLLKVPVANRVSPPESAGE